MRVRKTATYATPDGDVTTAFDFLERHPAAAARRKSCATSGLSWADKWTDQGWIEVDQKKPCATRAMPMSSVLATLTVCPKGKTAASVKWHQPVVEDHLISEIQGREGTKTFRWLHILPVDYPHRPRHAGRIRL